MERKLRLATIYVVAFIVFFAITTNTAVSSPFSLASILKIVNTSCIHYKVDGICIKHKHGKVKVGVKISLWEPLLIVETVHMPFQTSLPGVSEAITAFRNAHPSASKMFSSGSMSTEGMSTTQFFDVHVLNFPFSSWLGKIGSLLPMYCSNPVMDYPFPTVFYLTELDFVNWRQFADMASLKGLMSVILNASAICGIGSFTADLANNVADLVHIKIPFKSGFHLGNMCLGFWGTTYPRRGWIGTQSPEVGSAVDVYRAVSWDSISNPYPRVMFSIIPISPNTDDKLQLAYPKVSKCIDIGEYPAEWDWDLVSKTGSYLWIYWRKFTCCKY